MIFLDTRHDWVLAHNRQELIDAHLERIDPNNDDHILRLATACLGWEKEQMMGGWLKRYLSGKNERL